LDFWQVSVQKIRLKVLEWLASEPGFVKWCMSHEQLTMYFIVDDDQLAEARDDEGLKLWREQFPDWSWRQLNLTDLGLQQDKPMKVNDDCGKSLMMVTSHFTLGPAPLTIDERVQAQAPMTWQDGYLSQLDPETAQRYEDARREEIQEIKRSLMKKRRPDYYGLGDDDEDYGWVDDCY